MIGNKYETRFLNGLDKYNTENKTNYKIDDLKNEFDNIGCDFETDEEGTSCICGHPIHRQFILRNRTNDDEIILGSDCIINYVFMGLRVQCCHCEKEFKFTQLNYKHKDNLCKDCRKKDINCKRCDKVCHVRKYKLKDFVNCKKCKKEIEELKNQCKVCKKKIDGSKYTLCFTHNKEYKTSNTSYWRNLI